MEKNLKAVTMKKEPCEDHIYELGEDEERLMHFQDIFGYNDNQLFRDIEAQELENLRENNLLDLANKTDHTTWNSQEDIDYDNPEENPCKKSYSHPDFQHFKCNYVLDNTICSNTCKTKNALLNHQKHVHDMAICRLCGKGFQNVLEYRKHSREHENDGMCPFCQCTYISRKVFRAHLERHRHLFYIPHRIPYLKCQCGFKTKRNTLLKTHKVICPLVKETETELFKNVKVNSDNGTCTLVNKPESGDVEEVQDIDETIAQKTTDILNCSLCDFSNSKKSEFILHFSNDHASEYKFIEFECKENGCNFVCSKAEDLKVHLKKHWTWSKWYKCHKCFLNTNDIMSLECHFLTQHLKDIIKFGKIMERHVEAHRETKRVYEIIEKQKNIDERLAENIAKVFKCILCDFSYTKQSEIIEHFASDHTPEYNLLEFRCHVYRCSFISNKAKDLKDHLEKHIYSCEWYWCHVCSSNTKDIDILEHHLLTQHLKTMIKYCPECSFCEIDDHKMKEHTELHREINVKKTLKKNKKVKQNVEKDKNSDKNKEELVNSKLKCSFCESYVEKPEMVKHIRAQHSKEYKFVEFNCQLCAFMTKKSEHLLDHFHEDHPFIDFLFMCEKCTFQTESDFNLECHILISHLKAMIKYCDECSFCEINEENLQKHRQIMHSKTKNKNTSKTVILSFSCNLCAFSHLYKHEIIKHIRLEHFNEYKLVEFKCHDCSFNANKPVDLLEHFTQLHLHCPVLFKCNKCFMITKDIVAYEYHILTENLLVKSEHITNSNLSRHNKNQIGSEIPTKKVRIESQDYLQDDLLQEVYFQDQHFNHDYLRENCGIIENQESLSEINIKEEFLAAEQNQEKQSQLGIGENTLEIEVGKGILTENHPCPSCGENTQRGQTEIVTDNYESDMQETHIKIENSTLIELADKNEHIGEQKMDSKENQPNILEIYLKKETGTLILETEYKEINKLDHLLDENDQNTDFEHYATAVETFSKKEVNTVGELSDKDLQNKEGNMDFEHNPTTEEEICFFCDFKHLLRSVILDHYYTEHRVPILYCCRYCRYLTSGVDLFKTHYSQQHSHRPEWYNCPRCFININNIEEYKIHYVVQHIRNPCPICGGVRNNINSSHFCKLEDLL